MIRQIANKALMPARWLRRRWITRPARIRDGADRLLADPGGSEAQRRLIRAASLRVHPEDQMFLGSPEHYLSVGLSAVECIGLAIGPATPREILDFAGGYGRVLRFIGARFPDAKVSLAEVQGAALDFCEARFGVTPVPVPDDPLQLRLGGTYDLIWCGSLLTHLDAGRTKAVLGQFSDSLAPGGTAVVSTHGALAAGHDWTLQPITPEQRHAVLESFDEDGFAYAPYPETPNYGVTLCTQKWLSGIAAEVGLTVGWSGEAAWGGHQDVTALSRD